VNFFVNFIADILGALVSLAVLVLRLLFAPIRRLLFARKGSPAKRRPQGIAFWIGYFGAKFTSQKNGPRNGQR